MISRRNSLQPAAIRLLVGLMLAASLPFAGSAASKAELEQKAFAAYQANQLPQAIEFYRQLASLDPLEVQYHYNLGVLYQKSNQLPQAIAAYTQAIELDPSYAEAYTNLGAIYYAQKQWPKAIETYQRILGQRSSDADLNFSLALAYEAAGQLKQAMTTYQQVLQLNPEHAQARARYDALAQRVGNGSANAQLVIRNPGMQQAFQQARDLTERKQWSQALPLLTKLVAEHPDFADAQFLLGRTLFQSGKYAEAVEAFTQTVALQPDYIAAHHQMALAYERMGKANRSIDVLSNLLAIKPDYTPALYDLGRLYEDQAAPEKAIPLFEKLVRINAAYRDLSYRLGWAYHQLNRPDQAQAFYNQSIKQYPDFAPAYIKLAKLALKSDSLDSAQKLLEQAMALDSRNPEAPYLLATVWYRRNQNPELQLKYLNEAIQLNPIYVDALSMRGITHYSAGRQTLAIADFSKALSQAPDRADLHRNIAVAYVKAGMADKAVASFEAYLRYAPDAGDKEQIQQLINELKPYATGNGH